MCSICIKYNEPSTHHQQDVNGEQLLINSVELFPYYISSRLSWFAVSYQILGSHAGHKGYSSATDRYKMAAPLVEHRRMAWDDSRSVHLLRAARVYLVLLYKHIFLHYFKNNLINFYNTKHHI